MAKPASTAAILISEKVRRSCSQQSRASKAPSRVCFSPGAPAKGGIYSQSGYLTDPIALLGQGVEVIDVNMRQAIGLEWQYVLIGRADQAHAHPRFPRCDDG